MSRQVEGKEIHMEAPAKKSYLWKYKILSPQNTRLYLDANLSTPIYPVMWSVPFIDIDYFTVGGMTEVSIR